MESEEGHQQGGDEEYVHREEAGKGAPTDDRAPEEDVHEARSDAWSSGGDRCANPQAPVRILVPA